MIHSESFVLDVADDRRLHGVIDRPAGTSRLPTVVICHGFKGFMEWGFFPPLAELLASRGFLVVRFNLSGTGQQPGEDRVSDLAAFRANTHSRELEELLVVLDALDVSVAPGQVDLDRVGLLGHSRGGGNAILAAASSPWQDRLAAVVTWAAVSRFFRFPDEQVDVWRRLGELPTVNGRTGQELRLGVGLLDDLETNSDTLDILAAAARVRAPWLIVHGGADETVPPDEGQLLLEQAKTGVAAGGSNEARAEYHEIAEASHTFGARHPFVGPTPHLIDAMNATQRLFLRTLR